MNADACTPLVDRPEPDALTFNVAEPLFLMRCTSISPMARGWQLSRREETAQGTPHCHWGYLPDAFGGPIQEEEEHHGVVLGNSTSKDTRQFPRT